MIELTFHPANMQFLLHDIDDESGYWQADLDTRADLDTELAESGLLVRVSNGELSVALFEDAPATIMLSEHPERPALPPGPWEVQAEAALLIKTSVLGLSAVDDHEPRAMLDVLSDWHQVRVCERQATETLPQTFHVQLWPLKSRFRTRKRPPEGGPVIQT